MSESCRRMALLTENEALSMEMLGAVVEQMKAGQSIQRVGFRGVSMLPMLRQNKDAVDLQKPPEKLKKYDLPMYKGPSGKYVMHRIIKVKEDHYVCRGDHTYHPEMVKREQMAAVVCAFYRNGRRIPVTSTGYQLYCRCWHAIFPIRAFCHYAKKCLRKLFK